MPFANAEFDLIAAEQSLNMIPNEAKERVLQECMRVLQDSGRVIFKVQHVSPDFCTNIKNATDRFLKGEIEFPDYYMYLLHSYDGHCYDPHTGILPLKCDVPIIEGLVKQGVLPETVQELHKKRCAAHYSEHKLYLLSEEETEALIKQYFAVERVIRGTEFEMKRILPIYICRKK